MRTDLDLAALDAVVAGPWRVATDIPGRIETADEHYVADTAGDVEGAEAIVALHNAYPAMRQLIDQQAAELAEWRRLAADEVRADMQADSDLASALAEARADAARATAELAAARAERDDYSGRLETAKGVLAACSRSEHHQRTVELPTLREERAALVRELAEARAELERLRRVEAAARQVIEADDLMDDATVPGRVAVPAMREAKLALRAAMQGGQTGGSDG